MESSSRANRLFKLQERFPEESARLRALAIFSAPLDIPLALEGKRVLRYAVEEASQLDDYWIDTDHLTLGILRESSCAAAAKLDAVGLQIEEARKEIEASAEQRENYGRIPPLWWLAKPITRAGYFACMWYLLLIVVLVRFLTENGC